MAAMAAALVLFSACAAPTSLTLASPTPSPSPTPTAPLQLVAGQFHDGEVGVAYAPVALSAAGGVVPYTWRLFSGTLPSGLAIGGDGGISGTPTAAGSYDFWVQVADSGESTATTEARFSIWAPVSASLIPACTKYCNVELGCVEACGGFGTLSGGMGPYAFSLVGGTLPAGTSLSGSGFSLKGTFKGLSGYLKFAVRVTDAMGATATISPTFWMYDHISLASGNCTGNYITGCTVQLPIDGGVPGSTVTVRLLGVAQNPNRGCWTPGATTPPAGYALAVNGGNIMVSIPNRIINGYAAVWTLSVTDQGLCAPSTYCSSPQATVVIGVQCG